MKNILFPTDFSKNANHALTYALKIAKDFDANLHIINTYLLPYSQAVPTTQKLLTALKKSSITELTDYIKKIKSDVNYKDLKITVDAFEGNLINVVTDLEAEINYDLIVLGTKGASGIKEILIGSNAEQVVYHAKASVFVIPENASNFSFNNLALAVDLKEIKDTAIVNSYLALCKKYDSKIQLITVNLKETLSDEEEDEKAKLISLFSNFNPSFHLINQVDVLEGLNNFIESNNLSALAVLSRKHSFIENIFHKSITDKLTCRFKIPIFVIKEK